MSSCLVPPPVGAFRSGTAGAPLAARLAPTPHRASRRSQSSAAISVDGERWFLLNASPDVREQLDCLPGPIPTGIRHVPVEGIVATDAELDHTLGIVLLREARHLQLYATPAVAPDPGAGFPDPAGHPGVRAR